jgi:hypothetical protein
LAEHRIASSVYPSLTTSSATQISSTGAMLAFDLVVLVDHASKMNDHLTH